VPPARSVPEGIEPPFAAEVEYWTDRLDETDYFQILKLLPTAGSGEVKKSYHRESRAYHPDRFFQLPDEEFRGRVDKLYKRINEAYVVLRDDRKRAKYAADVQGPQRATKLRFTEESESDLKQQAKKEVLEQIGTTPQGRKFYEQGAKDLAAGRLADALRNFKMATTFEPGNALYKEKLEEATKGIPREKMDFRIK
jgi:curved DNA-binding protein CbpA